MALPPERNHEIPLEAAAAMTRRFRETRRDQVRAHMFPRTVFERLLAQPDCAGIRAYNGLNEKGEPTLILVGVDSDGANLSSGMLFDVCFPCPPYCDPPDDSLNR